MATSFWGSEILVNTIAVGDQSAPAVTDLANGHFVVTWTDLSGTLGDNSGSAVNGQVFDASGNKAGAQFLVNTLTPDEQAAPAITALADGRFVIAWEHSDGTHYNVRAQLFNVDGSRAGTEFLVNTTTALNQFSPTIATLADGRFVVAWEDTSSGVLEYDIRGQIFNSNGTKSGGELVVAAGAVDQIQPIVTALTDGRFVVAWTAGGAIDGSSTAVRAQIFNSNSTKYGFELAVNSTTLDGQHQPAMTALADGRFVIAWSDDSKTGGDISDRAVRAQVFNFDGSKSGPERLVNTTTLSFQAEPTIATLDDGRFAISFSDASQTGGDIRTQIFNPDGTKSGPEFLTNIFTVASPQYQPTIATLADGRLVVAYTDASASGGDTSGTAVRAQIFDPRHGAVHLAGGALRDDFVGTAFADTMIGGSGSDHLDGGADNDVLDGGVGSDTLIGGAGDDTFYIDSHADTVEEHANEGIDEVRTALASYDIAALPNVENLTGAAVTGQSLAGNAGNNVITGRGGNDTLIGEGGNDTLIGGLGNDTINGGPGDDVAVFSHNLNDYTLQDFGGKILAAGPDGTDTLTGIAHLQFADTMLTPVDDGNPLFDTLYYLSRNADVFHAGVNALDHFNASGWHEGRDPNSFFDVSGYLAVNPDVAAGGVNPLEHYHQTGWHQGRDPSAAFDSTLYLIHNPDVAAAGTDPLEHFLAHGFAEGRAAYAAVGPTVNGFDAQYYLFHNPDVAAAGVDLLAHFNTFGWHEGRNPNGYFDSAGYLAHYADVAASGANPLAHYEAFGWHEGRDPSAGFDTLGYLAANPDVAAGGANPLDHFLSFGIYEGRAAVNDGLWH